MYRFRIEFAVVVGMMLLLAIPGNVLSQITIDSDEYDISFGQELVSYSITGSLTINPAMSGGPQTWSFLPGDYPGGETITQTIIDPAGTPFGSDFPDADHAFHSAIVVYGDTAEGWSYHDLTNSSLLFLGTAGTGLGFEVVNQNMPPGLQLIFPATYNSSWTSNYVSISEPGGGLVIADSANIDYTMDAFGSVTIESGTFECLRIREISSHTFTTYFNGIPISVSDANFINYTWIVEGLGGVANIISKQDETDPAFTEATSIGMRTSGGTTAIDRTEPLLARDFRLEQNYPNPFNPSTTISFELPHSTAVDLKVFNLAGQQVATLYSGTAAAGAHRIHFDAKNLPSGIYFYSLSGDGVALSRRMILLK